jgi:RHS repeat-associated protein
VKLKSTSAVIASYRYDALGRRVEKNVGGAVERHVLSIWNEPGVVEDLSHVVSAYDGSDAWKQNFVWSDEVDGIQALEQKDVLDYDSDGNTTEVTRSFYHRNALGSVMEITDLNQAVVVSYRYDPYGKVTITRGGTPQSTDPLGNHWTFTGRFLDEETGLLHYRARCYDPATGRFMHRDPLGLAVGPNLFEYASSAPQTLADPSGLDDEIVLRQNALFSCDEATGVRAFLNRSDAEDGGKAMEDIYMTMESLKQKCDCGKMNLKVDVSVEGDAGTNPTDALREYVADSAGLIAYEATKDNEMSDWHAVNMGLFNDPVDTNVLISKGCTGLTSPCSSGDRKWHFSFRLRTGRGIITIACDVTLTWDLLNMQDCGRKGQRAGYGLGPRG